jgi:hypothetical protein
MGRGEANNGTNDWSNWVYFDTYYYPTTGNTYYYGGEIFGGWGQGGVFDCVTTGACTCVLMSDAYNDAGYWAITGNNNDAAVQTTLLRQPGNDAHGNATPIILRQVPVPVLTDVSVVGDTISVTASVTDSGNADYQLGLCDCVAGYLLYRFTTTGPPPTDRDVAAGWILIPGQPAGGTAFGESFSFDIVCSGTEDVYFATQIVGDQGFATGQLSANSAAVECDPAIPTATATGSSMTRTTAPTTPIWINPMWTVTRSATRATIAHHSSIQRNWTRIWMALAILATIASWSRMMISRIWTGIFEATFVTTVRRMRTTTKPTVMETFGAMSVTIAQLRRISTSPTSI